MNNFPEIETERLVLTQLTNSDWEMVCFLRSDKDVNKFVDRPGAETKEDALAFIYKINTAIESGNSYYWKITERFVKQTFVIK